MYKIVHTWNESVDKQGKSTFEEIYYAQSETDTVWIWVIYFFDSV